MDEGRNSGVGGDVAEVVRLRGPPHPAMIVKEFSIEFYASEDSPPSVEKPSLRRLHASHTMCSFPLFDERCRC